MIIKTPEQRASLIEGGRRLGVVLHELEKITVAGKTTAEINELAESLISADGDGLSFKDYQPEGASFPFPAALCISVNDEVVHGIPGNRVLKEGDIVSLDLGLTHNGIIVDSALTVPVGKTDKTSYALMDATKAALYAAVGAANVGGRIGDISHATEQAYKGTGFSVVKILGGHGVGDEVHEEPFVANVGYPGSGPEIVAGMVLALEPIANAGKGYVQVMPDGYTYRTRDGSRSAHFEHTILIEDSGTTIVTLRPQEQSAYS